jgi:hypothetical protein
MEKNIKWKKGSLLSLFPRHQVPPWKQSNNKNKLCVCVCVCVCVSVCVSTCVYNTNDSILDILIHNWLFKSSITNNNAIISSYVSFFSNESSNVGKFLKIELCSQRTHAFKILILSTNFINLLFHQTYGTAYSDTWQPTVDQTSLSSLIQ